VKTAPPRPLRATPATLADWAATVARAQRSHYPTLLVEPSLIVAIGRELEILRSRLAFYQQGEGESQ
jgi:hypothetical protein